MQLGLVVGHATSTIKHPTLEGWKLLVVQPVGGDGEPDGEPVLAVDLLGAGRGSMVILTSDGQVMREMMNDSRTPVRWSVMGLPDA